jgi:RHS repeat-associated protein
MAYIRNRKIISGAASFLLQGCRGVLGICLLVGAVTSTHAVITNDCVADGKSTVEVLSGYYVTNKEVTAEVKAGFSFCGFKLTDGDVQYRDGEFLGFYTYKDRFRGFSNPSDGSGNLVGNQYIQYFDYNNMNGLHQTIPDRLLGFTTYYKKKPYVNLSIEANTRSSIFMDQIVLVTPPVLRGTVQPEVPHRIMAHEATGMVFVNWTLESGSGAVIADPTSFSTTITIAEGGNATIKANFVKRPILTVTTSGLGSVSITPPADADGRYALGTPVTLLATPHDAQQVFQGWAGAAPELDVPGARQNPTVVLTLTDNRTVTANFGPAPISYQLNIIAFGGTVSVSPGPNAPNGKYQPGTLVTLTANHFTGFAFQGWFGGIFGTGTTRTITMDRDYQIIALFKPLGPYHLTLLNLNGPGSSTTITVNEGVPIHREAVVPAGMTFEGWAVVDGMGQVEISQPNSPGSDFTVRGGDITVSAKLGTPSVTVELRDAEADNPNLSSPQIRVHNKPTSSTLVNFELDYFFQTECLRNPVSRWDPPPSDWSRDIISLGGGNYKLAFTYNGSLAPGAEITTPPGLELYYDCASCDVWKRYNDWSLIGVGANFKEIPVDGPVLVINNAGAPRVIHGVVPAMTFISTPDQPDGSEDKFLPNGDSPFLLPKQSPNLIFSQEFPVGNMAPNGSFENGTNGWSPVTPGLFYSQKHELGLEAHDGYYSVGIASNTSHDGIHFEILDTDPAFKKLYLQTVTFSAWVRTTDPVHAGTVNLVITQGDGTSAKTDPFKLTSTWQFISMTTYLSAPFSADALNWYSFSIERDLAGLPATFFVDGVTLTPSGEYIPVKQKYTFANTRNSVMQTRTIEPAENIGSNTIDPQAGQVVVENTEYDALGRAGRIYLPYIDPCPAASCNPIFDLDEFRSNLNRSNSQYLSGNPYDLPDAGGYAYREPIYENDQLTTLKRTGKPGLNFHQGSGHVSLTFYSGVSDLNPANLGSDRTLPANNAAPKFAYSLIRDENGHETLEWKNGFGQIVQTGKVMPGTGGQEAIALERGQYDKWGNVRMKYPPISCKNPDGTNTNLANCVDPIEQRFDSQNRMIEEVSPDAGTTEYFYDKTGLKRMTQTSTQRVLGKFSVNVYDDLGRIVYSGEYRDKEKILQTRDAAQSMAEDRTWPAQDNENLELTAKYFYDVMPQKSPAELSRYNSANGKDVRLYSDVDEGTFQYTKGRLCAVIAFQKPVDGISDDVSGLMEPFFTTAYKYDKYGRVVQTYTYNGFLTEAAYKLQSNTNFYDDGGRLIQVFNYDQWPGSDPSKNTFLSYDAAGRLKEVEADDGTILASYTYFPTTNRVKTVFIDKDEDNSARIDYLYHVSGAIKSIDAVRTVSGSSQPIYAQDLFYDILPSGQTGTPQYNGNISASEYSFTDRQSGVRSVAYSYDNSDRLLRSLYQLDDGVVNGEDDRFDEAITYDDNGRITSMRRGAKAALPNGGAYAYKGKTNQLLSVSPGMDDQIHPRKLAGEQGNPNFVYDDDGRMVADHSKGLVIRYDHRGLPLEFSYSSTTAGFRVLNRYDHDGSRIAKLLIAQDGAVAFDKLLVDEDDSRDQDYPTLAMTLDDLESKVAPLHQAPPPIQIHVVPDENGYVDLADIDEIHPLAFVGGEAGLEIDGVYPDSPEYLALLNARDGSQSLVQSTHYTNVGNEIRQDFDVSGTTTKIFTNLTGGIGRYNPDKSRQFYVRNYLGSTVAAFGENDPNLSDIFDYHPYGLQSKLMTSGFGKITETYAAKELDEEEKRLSQEIAFAGLYYFGARFYEPELGMWISPDPLGQYQSPYTYSGNDPVNSVDRTGLAGGKVLLETVEKVGERFPRNAEWAGKVHPSGVPFNVKGFPDFSKWAVETVQLEGLTGKYGVDEAMALKELGMKATPEGFVWHHVEDGKTMQLIPDDIHNAAQHTGGAAVIRAASTASAFGAIGTFIWSFFVNPGADAELGHALMGPDDGPLDEY